MINLETIQRLYFIGIGGIGMSAIARYFAYHGKQVSGYDRTETALTRQLVNEGIVVTYIDDAATAPQDVQLVVYTPAVPADHAQLNFYRENGYQVVKRSDVLGAITESSFNICIAGTHGKTTISTMVAHILTHTGYGCNAFLGGIAVNYNSNFWSSEKNVCVIEADEYDRSFLKLSPDVAVISAMDADHLDIYGTEEAMQDAFVQFAGKIKPSGTLIVKKGLSREKELQESGAISYSLDDAAANIHPENIRIINGRYEFDLVVNKEVIKDAVLHMGGMHNVENASVAMAVAKMLDIDAGAIRLAIESFRGVKRRFEYIVKSEEIIFIDDYAHHPEELSALIGGAKGLYPDHHCIVIFQPHLFSRTRDLANEFAASLDRADQVLLLPIYPARELPVEGVSSDMIIIKMKNKKSAVVGKNELSGELKRIIENRREGKTLLITAGAGDIDAEVNNLKNILSESIHAG